MAMTVTTRTNLYVSPKKGLVTSPSLGALPSFLQHPEDRSLKVVGTIFSLLYYFEVLLITSPITFSFFNRGHCETNFSRVFWYWEKKTTLQSFLLLLTIKRDTLVEQTGWMYIWRIGEKAEVVITHFVAWNFSKWERLAWHLGKHKP